MTNNHQKRNFFSWLFFQDPVESERDKPQPYPVMNAPEPLLFCDQCGFKNERIGKFCARCGNTLQ